MANRVENPAVIAASLNNSVAGQVPPILVAQADIPPQQGAGQAAAPAIVTVELEAGSVLRLPEGASIDAPRLNGSVLEFVQPDGSVIAVPNGAVDGLTIMLGAVEIPAIAVAALFEQNDIQAAAGPEGAEGSGYRSPDRYFAPDGDNDDDVAEPGDLLANSEFLAPGGAGGPSTYLTNFAPLFGGGTLLAGSILESGIADSSSVFTVDLLASDPESGPLTFTFGAPPAGLASGRVALSWLGEGTSEMRGSVNGVDVIRASIVNGQLIVTVLQPLDHTGSGADSLVFDFTVIAYDGQTSTTATVQITAVDDVPAGDDWERNFDEDNAIEGQLSGAAGADGFHATAYAIGNQPSHGTLVIDPQTGSYTYSPERDFFGEDSFTYTITDADGDVSAPITVTLTINPVNDAPVAADDTGTAIEAGGVENGTAGQNATGNVLLNDSDVDDANPTLKVSAFRAGAEAGTGPAGTVGTALVGTYGSLTLNEDGTYSYAVDNTNAAVQALRLPSQTLNESFTYTVTDPSGATDTATLTITINGANDAPVAVADTGSVREAGRGSGNSLIVGSPFAAGNVLRNDTDVDAGDSIKVTDVTAGETERTVGLATSIKGIYGILVLSSTGGWIYTLDNTDADTRALAHGERVDDVFVYTIVDRAGATAQSTLTIEVTGTNDRPEIRAAQSQLSASGTEDTSSLSGTMVFRDDDANDLHSVSHSVTTSASGGVDRSLLANAADWFEVEVTDESAGVGTAGEISWSFAAGQSLQFLAAGERVTLTYMVTVRDAIGANVKAPVVITITGTNDAPQINAVAAIALTEPVAPAILSKPITVTFTDVDLNDVGHSARVTDVVVTGRKTGLMLDEDALVDLLDVESITKLAGSANGTLELQFNAPAGAFDYLRAGQTVTLKYTVEIDDGDVGTATKPVVITITGTNDAPVAINDTASVSSAGFEDGRATLGQPFAAGNVLNNDTDLDHGDSKTVTSISLGGASSNPDSFIPAVVNGTYGTLTIWRSGAWTYTLNNLDADTRALGEGEIGTEEFTYVMRDGSGATSTATLTLNVTGANDLALIRVDATASNDRNVVEAGHEVAGDASASGKLVVLDVDTGENVFAAVDTEDLGGEFGNFTFDNGTWTYTLDNSLESTQSLAKDAVAYDTLTVHSADGTASHTIRVTITGTNDAPVITSSEQLGAVTEDVIAPIDAPKTVLADYSSYDIDALLGKTGAGTTFTFNYTDMATVLGRLEAADLGKAEAIAAVWQHLDRIYTGGGDLYGHQDLNAAGVRLGVEYARYLQAGGAPLTDWIAKFEADNNGNGIPQRLQSLHDNLLGNLHFVTINDRFGADLKAELFDLIETLGIDLSDRPVFDGREGITNSSASFDVANGLLPGATGQLTATDVDSAILTWSGNQTSEFGSIAVDPKTGHWSFFLNPAAAQKLAAGQQVDQEYTVTVTDQHGASATTTVTITITGTNDVPVISTGQGDSASAALTEANSTRSAEGTLTVSDVDRTDIVTSSIVSATSSIPNRFTEERLLSFLTLNPEVVIGSGESQGTLTWKFKSDTAFNFLTHGQTLTLNYTVRVDDGQDGQVDQVISIVITGTNDAPRLTSSTHALTSIDEDALSSASHTVASILGTNVVDVDAGALRGMAVTGTENSEGGSWEYSLDNGTNWIGFGEVSNQEALLLRATDLVRYVPDQENGETARFTYRAWDQTSGTAGSKADTTANGGNTAFSLATSNAEIVVMPVNDAPVLSGSATGAVTESGDIVGIREAGAGSELTHSFTLDQPATTALAAIKAGDTSATAFDDAFDAVTALAGTPATFAVFWEYLNANYDRMFTEQGNDPINVASARLALAYVEHLKNGGMPLTDIMVHYAADGNANGIPDRAQSLHDNILGHLNEAVLGIRFSDPILAEIKAATPEYFLDRPWVSGYDSATTLADEAHTGDMANGYAPSAKGALQVSDVDDASVHTWSIVGSDNGTYGKLTLDQEGNWTYVLDNNRLATQRLAAGAQQTETFTVRVTDAEGASDEIGVTITVTGTNDGPVAKDFNSQLTIAENAVQTGLNFGAIPTELVSDVDTPTSHFTANRFAIAGVSIAGKAEISAALAGITIDDDGNISIDTKVAAYDYLRADQEASVVVRFIVTDDGGLSDEGTVTFKVSGTNDAVFSAGRNVVDLSLVGEHGIQDGNYFDAMAGDDEVSLPKRGSFLFATYEDHFNDGGTFYAGAGNDRIQGNVLNDRIDGGDGDDVILGGSGDDIIYGGAGNDELRGEGHNDTIYGGDGNDFISGGSWNDTLFGEAGDDTIHGDNGDDTLDGGAGNDRLYGGNGNDVLRGGDGADQLSGDTGTNTLIGGAGNDQFFATAGDNTIWGNDENAAIASNINAVAGESDTVVYYGTQSNFQISLNSNGSWTVYNTANGTTDTLRGIEGIDFNGGGVDLDLTKSVQVFNASNHLVGTYDCIQAAIDAADPAFNVRVAAGTYNEQLTVREGITIEGVGEVIVNGGTGITLLIGGGGADQDLSIKGINFVGNGTRVVSVEKTATYDSVSLTDGEIRGGQYYGMHVNESAGILAFTLDKITFSGNATTEAGSGETALYFWLYNGNITLRDIDIEAPGANAEYAIQIRGKDAYADMGTVVLDGVTVSGAYAKNAVAIYHYDNVDGLNIVELNLSATASTLGWHAFNMDGILGSYDASRFGLILTATQTTNLQGDKTIQVASDQTITGTPNGDVIRGGRGVDTLHGGAGNDVISGEDGDDVISGGSGNDTILGGAGKDRLHGNGNADTIYGGDGDDDISGGSGGDILYGDAGDDIIHGDNGNDTLYGGAGNDRLYGGNGDDTLVDTGGLFDGGAGNDTADLSGLSGRLTLDLAAAGVNGGYALHGSTFVSIENIKLNANDTSDPEGHASSVQGTEGANVFNGSGRSDHLDGRGGDDTIFGHGGNDTIVGGAGADTMDGGAGVDTLALAGNIAPSGTLHYVNLSTNTVSGGELDGDTIANFENVTAAHDTKAHFVGDDQDNVLTGSNAADILEGGKGNDTLVGDTGWNNLANSDELYGGEGDDTLIGGGGNDFLDGGAGIDTAVFKGPLSDYTIRYVAGSTPQFVVTNTGAQGDGVDTVQNVENFQFGGVNLAPIMVFGADGMMTDTYTDLQIALMAAGANSTIFVGPGNYVGNFVIDKPVTLLSLGGAEHTTITGNQTGGELGTLQLTNGSNGTTIGGIGNGFRIVGIDGTPGLEKAAIYLQGARENVRIVGNEVVANGDSALLSEYGGGLKNATITHNLFSGQTFEGGNPGDGEQFVDPNVPRQVVVIGNGGGDASTANSNNIVFANNTISAETTGYTTGNVRVGNTLVTIDAINSSIKENVFESEVLGNAIRVRRPDTSIEDNEIGDNTISVGVTGSTSGSFEGNTSANDLPASFVFSGSGLADILQGGAGDDILTGGNGEDILWGGTGTDTLIGGAGNDTFVFKETGSDTIWDYVHGEDIVDLSELLADADDKAAAVLLDNNSISVKVGDDWQQVANLNGSYSQITVLLDDDTTPTVIHDL